MTTYISFGSNQGDRFYYLQSAVQVIFEKVGQITKVSKIYETPAWGFAGNEFLNACIAVKTRLSAEQVLTSLLEIETQFGRKRSRSGYQNRTLDLDILFYNNARIEIDDLIVPHPRVEERRFVLQPLCDIAPDLVHPISGKKISQLLRTTPDRASLSVSSQSLKIPKCNLGDLSYLAIEGNIGAGKTSLATMIAQDFRAKLITERFKDNPFLPKFYKNQKRYAFPLEMSFLADRHQQLIDDIAQYDLFSDFIVADYDIYKSMIFAEITLTKEEFNLYKRLFNIMYKDMAKPDLYIYLYQSTTRLLENIKKRGRGYEQNIPGDYLNKINRGYLNFIKTQNHLRVKIIDVTDLDFIYHREDYLYILREIHSVGQNKS